MIDLVHDLVHECFHVMVRHRGRLEVFHAVLGRHLLRVLKTDLALLLQIDLVADEDLGDVLFCVLIDAVEPLAHVLERVCIG